MDVLVLGARGGLGRLVCEELAARGHRTRTVTRGEAHDAAALVRAAAGAAAIVNCAGASVALGLGHGWRGYRAVDTPIGLAAAAAARRAPARLVYVAVHHAPELARTAYVDAHERVVAAMRDLDGVVVRATGFFSAYAALLPLARRGILADIGDGRAHEPDPRARSGGDRRRVRRRRRPARARGGRAGDLDPRRDLRAGGRARRAAGEACPDRAAAGVARGRERRRAARGPPAHGPVRAVRRRPRAPRVIAPALGTRTLASYLDALEAAGPGAGAGAATAAAAVAGPSAGTAAASTASAGAGADAAASSGSREAAREAPRARGSRRRTGCRSTGPSMPGTAPRSVCCQNVHRVHGAGTLGHSSV